MIINKLLEVYCYNNMYDDARQLITPHSPAKL